MLFLCCEMQDDCLNTIVIPRYNFSQLLNGGLGKNVSQNMTNNDE